MLMKQIIALLFSAGLLLPSGGSARSQSLSAGINAGVDISTANTSEDLSLSSRKGLILGGAVELTLVQPLTFRAGIQYVEKGFQVTTTSGGTTAGDYNFNYLDFPINLKLSLGNPSFDPFVFAGTTLGTVLSATQVANGTSQDVKDQLSSVAMSLDLGGGIGFEFSRHLSLVTQATYSFGLTDAAKEQSSFFNRSSWKARELKLTTGLFFTLGG
jgi:hypothetical protein